MYFSDYEEVLGRGLPSMYHVADTWENYDKIAPVISSRFSKWRQRRDTKWWEFWK